MRERLAERDEVERMRKAALFGLGRGKAGCQNRSDKMTCSHSGSIKRDPERMWQAACGAVCDLPSSTDTRNLDFGDEFEVVGVVATAINGRGSVSEDHPDELSMLVGGDDGSSSKTGELATLSQSDCSSAQSALLESQSATLGIAAAASGQSLISKFVKAPDEIEEAPDRAFAYDGTSDVALCIKEGSGRIRMRPDMVCTLRDWKNSPDHLRPAVLGDIDRTIRATN